MVTSTRGASHNAPGDPTRGPGTRTASARQARSCLRTLSLAALPPRSALASRNGSSALDWLEIVRGSASLAANWSGDDRVRLVDLSDFKCTATQCPQVVGGALVLRDTDHLTRTFSTTLGPYRLRALD